MLLLGLALIVIDADYTVLCDLAVKKLSETFLVNSFGTNFFDFPGVTFKETRLTCFSKACVVFLFSQFTGAAII
jgi:hypothetical protein